MTLNVTSLLYLPQPISAPDLKCLTSPIPRIKNTPQYLQIGVVWGVQSHSNHWQCHSLIKDWWLHSNYVSTSFPRYNTRHYW